MLLSFAKIGRISTHALREEGDCLVKDIFWQDDISTHALREEGDLAGRRNRVR